MSSLGCGYDNSKKSLVISFSLIMRLLEWAKEDAKDDIALHQMMEKLMAFNDGTNPLGIEVYDCLIKDATGSSLSNEEDEEEGKVDREFADYIQNIHDSYYEGGIGGEKVKQCINDYCYDESMDNMYDYEGGAHCCHEAAPVDYEAIQAYQDQMAHCCHEAAPIDYTDIECCKPSCCANICPENEQGNGAVFTISAEGDITDGECSACEETLPQEVEDQMVEIINLAKC